MSTHNAQDNKHAELRRAALEYHEFPTPVQLNGYRSAFEHPATKQFGCKIFYLHSGASK